MVLGGEVPANGLPGLPVSGWSNPNLLENWYFQDPVNQRGQEEYAGGKMYCIDRLYIRNKNLNVSLVDRGIKIQRSWDVNSNRVQPGLIDIGRVQNSDRIKAHTIRLP